MLQPLDHKTKTLLDLADYVEKSDYYCHLESNHCFMGHCHRMIDEPLEKLFDDDLLDYKKLIIAQPFTWDWDKKEEIDPNDNWYPNATQAASCLRHYALTGVVDWKRVRDQEVPATAS